MLLLLFLKFTNTEYNSGAHVLRVARDLCKVSVVSSILTVSIFFNFRVKNFVLCLVCCQTVINQHICCSHIGDEVLMETRFTGSEKISGSIPDVSTITKEFQTTKK